MLEIVGALIAATATIIAGFIARPTREGDEGRSRILPSKIANLPTPFILGAAGVVAWLLPIIGVPIAIIGIGLSIRAAQSNDFTGLTAIGLILCAVSLAVSSANASLGFYKNYHVVSAEAVFSLVQACATSPRIIPLGQIPPGPFEYVPRCSCIMDHYLKRNELDEMDAISREFQGDKNFNAFLRERIPTYEQIENECDAR